ncbi:hypothetical protein ACFWY9_03070 [Amycolatopsis sp. NPDC059027]|uniref:hypothetical protein n=1 Tax=unclassified Amycolatopsis TaxID=2618356 RepID=UPI00366D6BB0
MSTEQPANPPSEANWGDQPPAKKSWSGRKTAIAAGIAVVIVAGGGAAIWASASGSDNAQTQGPSNQGGPGGPGPGGQPGKGNNAGGGAAALRNALHGDFVVADRDGGYTTERLQTGDITAISATSISLTSKDGYQQTYTIDSSTKKTGDPKTGQTVTVVAKVSGQTATATTIGQQGQRQGQGTGRRGGN